MTNIVKSPRSILHWAARLASLAGLVFLLAYASLTYTGDINRVGALWLANGLMLATLMCHARKFWPALIAAGALGDLAANLAAGTGLQMGLGLTAVDVFEYSLCAELLARNLVRDFQRLSLADAPRCLAIIGGVAVITASLVTALSAPLPLAQALPAVGLRALSNGLGLTLLTPCFIAVGLAGRRLRFASARDFWPFALLAAAVLLTFLQPRYPAVFLIPPALLFVTWRLRLFGAATGVLMIAVPAVLFTLAGMGPFAAVPGPEQAQVLALQMFLAFCFLLGEPVEAVAARIRATHEALRTAHADLRAEALKVGMAQSVAQLGYWRFDAVSRQFTLSAEMLRLFGLEPDDDAAIKRVLGRIDPRDRRRGLASLRKALLDGQPYEENLIRIRQPDGGLRYGRGRTVVERGEDGAILGLFGVVFDRTTATQALLERDEAKARYRLITEQMHDVVLRASLDGELLYVSPSCRAYGYEPEDLVGLRARELVHPHDVARLLENTRQLLQDGVADPTRDRQHRLRRKDGGYVWMEGNPVVVRDEDGRPIEILNVLRDITERRAALAAVADSEARYRTLAHNANDLILGMTLGGAISYASPSCLALTGRPPEAVLRKKATSFVHPDDAARLRDAFAEQVRSGGAAPSRRIEFRTRTQDGRWIWMESKPKAIVDPGSGRVTGITDVARDITERKTLEAELRAARADAEAAVVAKAQFLATMSHELRTPLNSIVGFTQLASARTGLDPVARGYVERVGEASRSLLSVVNDILDFSKLEAGEVKLAPRAVDLPALARATLELLSPQAAAKGLELVLECDAPEGTIVGLDPDRLRQVLLNLVGNAVKFTAAGGVTVRVGYQRDTAQLAVEVRDTGPGIAPDQLERLFKRFSQVDGSLAQAHGGTGLGLAICKGIVEAMGGAISVTSTVGEGSTFAFTAPAPLAELDAADPPDEAIFDIALTGLRVLVADDNPANRELARLFLAGAGAETDEACDGEDAVRRAAAEPYAVILMDVRMPGLDGPGALAQIRAVAGPNRGTPVLAFTADADVESARRLRACGFEGVVAKPVEPGALIGAVAEASAGPAPVPSCCPA